MATQARKIIDLDIKDLLRDLDRAYCTEWLCYYAWWYMAQVVEGKGYEDMAEMLEKNAEQEYEHAAELAERILELGGLPTGNFGDIEKNAACRFPGVMADLSNYDEIIKIVTEGEACAIDLYSKLARKTFGKDHATHQLILHILDEEINHEEMFENLKGKDVFAAK